MTSWSDVFERAHRKMAKSHLAVYCVTASWHCVGAAAAAAAAGGDDDDDDDDVDEGIR